MRGGLIHKGCGKLAEIDGPNVPSAEQLFTRRMAAHAKVEWPDDTELHWAHAARVGVRLTRHWLSDFPKRQVSDRGVRAVLTRMLRF